MDVKNLILNAIRNECLISVDIAKLILKNQSKSGYIDDKKRDKVLIKASNIINKRSILNQDIKKHNINWIKEQLENNLPNQSSGSLITALLDVDNIFPVLECVLDDFDEEFVNEVYDYISDIIYEERKRMEII